LANGEWGSGVAPLFAIRYSPLAIRHCAAKFVPATRSAPEPCLPPRTKNRFASGTKEGSGAPKGALSIQCPRQARLRAILSFLPRLRGRVGRGTPPFGAHAYGTRHRLLPRWLSPRTGFPNVSSSRVFCPLTSPSVKHAPCRPVLLPVDRGPRAARVRIGNSARGHRTSLRFSGMPSGKAPSMSEVMGYVTGMGTDVKSASLI
jgi:hypothetical protein